MDYMNAVVLAGHAKLEFRRVNKPTIGPDDILLRVEAGGICGGDVHFYRGIIDGPDNMVIGHEFAGTIEAVGERVTRWKPGDRIVSDNTGYVCGTCHSCNIGHFSNCQHRKTLGISMDGGFAEYVRIPGEALLVSPNCVYRLPDAMSCAEATVLEPAANAYRTVIQESRVMPGDTVVVYGPGTFGLLCVQMAKLAGAANIILISKKSARSVRTPIGVKFGATHVLESDTEPDFEARVAEIAGSQGVAAVFDCVGKPEVLLSSLRMARNEGYVNRVGMNNEPIPAGFNLLTEKSITLQGHMGYDADSWKNCISLWERGMLDLKGVITETLPLIDFETGIRHSMDGSAAKVILVP